MSDFNLSPLQPPSEALSEAIARALSVSALSLSVSPDALRRRMEAEADRSQRLEAAETRSRRAASDGGLLEYQLAPGEVAIQYFGQSARVNCDRRCDKAWGTNARPTIQLDPSDPDDTVILPDHELGTAPTDPGTREGNDAKPLSPDEFPNKWCVRQCERSAISPAEAIHQPLRLPDYSVRRFNMPWKHSGNDAGATVD